MEQIRYGCLGLGRQEDLEHQQIYPVTRLDAEVLKMSEILKL